MPFKFGNKNGSKIYKGTTEISKVFKGETLVFSGAEYYLEFDGSNDYVSMGNNLQIAGDIEIEVEIDFISILSTNVFVSSGFDGNDVLYQFRYREEGLQLFTFFPIQTVEYSWNPNLNQKYTLKATIQNNVYKLFIDGTEVASQTFSSTPSSANGEFTLGASNQNGNIDRHANINMYYARINNGTNDVAEWLFDEGSGTTLNDNIGNNDGTIVGATWEQE